MNTPGELEKIGEEAAVGYVKVLVSQFDWRVSEKPQNRLGIVGVSAEV
jgi:hypothetical protein